MLRSQLLPRALATFFFIFSVTTTIAQENKLPPPQFCDKGEVATILEEKEGFLERVCDDNQITFAELESEESSYVELLASLSKRVEEGDKIEADMFENLIRSMTESIVLFHKAMETF